MKKHKWIKWTLVVITIPSLVIGGIVLWGFLEYGPNPPIPHKRITITLPFRPENEPKYLIPMGETIEHNFAGGHPGIDFQWDYEAPLIAVADGKVDFIGQYDKDLILNVKMGEYVARYKELEKVEPGIKKGSLVKKGEVLAYPKCHQFPDNPAPHCQLHWEFAYSSFLAHSHPPDRLCPLTYFDKGALNRINTMWDKVQPNDKFKKDFPHICSNVYNGHDQ